MGNSFKRFLALALAVFMVVGMLPTNIAFATENEGDTTLCNHGYVASECETCNPPEEPSEDPSEEPSEEPSEDGNVMPQSEGGEQTDETNVTYVAKVGDTEYATLAEAVANAQPGDTVALQKDVTENITVDKSLAT